MTCFLLFIMIYMYKYVCRSLTLTCTRTCNVYICMPSKWVCDRLVSDVDTTT